MRKWALGVVIVLLAGLWGAAQGLEGSWEATIQLLPSVDIYESIFTLKYSFATDWSIESESKIYSGVFKYQNFYLDGSFGDWDVWGKIYFNVQDVRYQKAWVNFEMPLPGEDNYLRLNVNHWSSEDDYSSDDKKMFGPWPCVNVVSWDEAWRHIGRTLYVEGPVVGYYYSGYLKLNIGRDYPDTDRFEIYIPSGSVDDFEAVFGDNFWEDWAASGQVVCIYGTIEGYRWTYGGPRNEGYSVAQIYLTDPDDLSLGKCCGYPPATSCPGQVIRWFEAHMHNGETLWIQGPVASITGPGTYYGYPNTYRVRIGGGGSTDNRVEVIMSSHPGWSTVGSSYDTVVCVYGKITVHGDIAVIEPPDLIEAREGPCCGAALLPGTFMDYRFRLVWDPLTITVDFGDCCTGTGLRKLELELESLSLCCGLTYDLDLVFSKCHGFEELGITLKGMDLGCCDISAEIDATFTVDGKSVEFKPSWPNIEGCVSVWGDVDFSGNTITGWELYGFGFTCSFDGVEVKEITALNPDKIEDLTDIKFYEHEWEYLSLKYTFSGCCGGEGSFQAQFWFGSAGVLFDLQRVRVDLEVPLAENISVLAKTQLDLSQASPIDWFDIGWTIEF